MRPRNPLRLRLLTLLAIVAWAQACTPSWDWRKLTLREADLSATFPCKPMIRVVAAKGLAVCEHRGLQFSIAWEMLEDPSRLREALAQSAPGLAHRLSLRVQGRQAEPPPPNGALSFPESGAYRLEDGGRAGLLLTWVFGARVYQALVQGPAGDLGLARQFHEGLSHPGVGDRPG